MLCYPIKGKKASASILSTRVLHWLKQLGRTLWNDKLDFLDSLEVIGRISYDELSSYHGACCAHDIERVRRSPLLPERDLTRHKGQRGSHGHPRCTQSVQRDCRSKDDVVNHLLGPEHDRIAHHRPGLPPQRQASAQCEVFGRNLLLQTRQTLQK